MRTFVHSLLLTLFLAGVAGAQSWRSGSVQGQTQSEVLREQAAGLPGVFIPPLDAVVDAEYYTVGPGDLFAVNIWTSPPLSLMLSVSAEGTLVIPNVGEISIGGKSLRSARSAVMNEIRKKILIGDPTVTLMSPRAITVRVQGPGMRPGSYEMNATDRVQSILSRPDIMRLTPHPDRLDQRDGDQVPILGRSIQVRRNDGTVLRVDLDKFAAYRESKWSPYLREGDEVIFSEPSRMTNYFTIGGAVLGPGKFEHHPGDRLQDALLFARGVHANACLDSIVILRVGRPTVIVAVEDSVRFSDAMTELTDGDRIIVPGESNQHSEGIVTVSGEVNQPGVYPILIGQTRVTDVIAMAGGVTPHAMLNGGGVFRRPMGITDAKNDRLISTRGIESLEDTSYVRVENELRILGERASADLRIALADPSSRDNVDLLDGDRIVIPRKTGSVYVFGQVRSPGHVRFEPGLGSDDYIAHAGGFTEIAKEDEVIVIKRSSWQWMKPSLTQVEEGDLVWIPKHVDRGLSYDLSIYTSIASIVSATATIILLVIQLGK